MPLAPVAYLLDELRACRLLTDQQLGELGRLATEGPTDAERLRRDLVTRGWLTPFQAAELASGRGQGLVLGAYVLIERLGEGGMGQVFKARHQTMKRLVAVKLIRKEQLASPDAVKRFYREVEAAAQLAHPNIVVAHDAGEANGTHFLAMEFVDGTDLATLVQRHGPLPIGQACALARQVAVGLQHAHERGLVHRDIKPGNLVVARSAELGARSAEDCSALRTPSSALVKILDFGLARFTSETAPQGELTTTGQVMGTPDFIAPEQAEDTHNADIRADIFSLGCTLFYLLTGQVPFGGNTLMEKLTARVKGRHRALRAVRPSVPPGLESIVHRMLERDPAARYQTPAEVAAALALFAQSAAASERAEFPPADPAGSSASTAETIDARPRAASSRTASLARGPKPSESEREASESATRWPLWVGLISLVVVVSVVIAWLQGLGDSPATVPASSAGTAPVGTPGAVVPPVPRDNNLLPAEVQAAWKNDARQPPPELVGAILPPHQRSGSLVAIVFTPDGQSVVAASESSGALRPGVVWSHDLAAKRTTHLWDGGSQLPAAAFSTDAKMILAKAANALPEDPVLLREVATGQVKERLRHLTRPVRLVIAADGRHAAALNVDHTATVWDIPPRMDDALKVQAENGKVLAVAFTSAGRPVIAGTERDAVKLWDLDGKELGALSRFTDGAHRLAFAPRGPGDSADVFAYGGNRQVQLWELAADKAKPRPWTDDQKHPGEMTALTFSPNGQLLASACDKGLVVVRNTATAKTVHTWQLPLAVHALAWSPDGKRVATANADGTVYIFEVEK